MSENLDPSLTARRDDGDIRVMGQVSTAPAHIPDVPLLHAQGQGAQRHRSSLCDLVERIPEPAALIRHGRLVTINRALAELLQHPRPALLSGLPADALLEGHEKLGPQHVALRAASGPVRARLSRLDMAVHDDQGAIWIFSPPAGASPREVQSAVSQLEDLCAELWELSAEEHPYAKDLVRRIDSAIDSLVEEEEEEEASNGPGFLEDVVWHACARYKVTLADLEGEVPSPPLLVNACVVRTLEATLASAASGSRCELRIDAAGHPTLVIRCDDAPVYTPDDVLDLRRQLALVRGSLILMDEGHARVRLPASPPMRAQA